MSNWKTGRRLKDFQYINWKALQSGYKKCQAIILVLMTT